MPNPTIAACYPKALLDFAVSRGADRQMLIDRSHICVDDLKDQDNRIPLAHYMALLNAGIELCNEPALSLLFGEAVRMQDISLVGLIGVAFENVESVRQQVNRYAPLTLDADDARVRAPETPGRPSGVPEVRRHIRGARPGPRTAATGSTTRRSWTARR
jgi:hypothetical protein